MKTVNGKISFTSWQVFKILFKFCFKMISCDQNKAAEVSTRDVFILKTSHFSEKNKFWTKIIAKTLQCQYFDFEMRLRFDVSLALVSDNKSTFSQPNKRQQTAVAVM